MNSLFKKTTLFVATLLMFASASKAQVQEQKRDPMMIDKVIAVIGNEAILLSDVEMDIYERKIRGVLNEDNMFCKVLEEMLTNKLFIAQAKIDSLVVDESTVKSEVDRRINMYIAQVGSERKLEEQFNKPMNKIRELLEDQASDQILIQKLQRNLTEGIEITPDDAEKFYKKIPEDSIPTIPEQYEYQQITVYPPTAEANFKVREKLLTLRERIMKGEKFSTLAVLYSDDTESGKRGGELGLAPASNYVTAFRNAALSLKTGQVSQIVETEYGFHIIQMIEKQGSDLINVRHILLKPAYSAKDQSVAFGRLDSIKNFITSDSISFEHAAMYFSQDEKTRLSGGYVVNEKTDDGVPSPRFEKDQLQSDYFVLRDMKEGQVSDPFKSADENGREVYKIIKLKTKIPAHKANLKQDFSYIQDMAINQKRMEKINKWMNNKRSETYVRIDDDYKNCKFDSKDWVR